MIETATAQAKDFPNVSLFVRDGRDLHEFHNQFDVAVTVNSILLPKVKDCEKMIQEAYNLLKDGGIILGIFPAMESHLYRALLIQEKTLDDGETEEIATQKAKEDVFKRFTILQSVEATEQSYRQIFPWTPDPIQEIERL